MGKVIGYRLSLLAVLGAYWCWEGCTYSVFCQIAVEQIIAIFTE
ncbi:MAG: hypothetical protein ACTIJ2_14010 [Sphingobacteriaceae bacterium]